MIVESRCAITMVVRPLQSSAIASCTWCSDSESSAAVASSSRMMGAFLIRARAFAARELVAVLAYGGVVARREAHDEIMRMRGLGGGDDLGLGRVGLAEGDVVTHRGAEQKNILANPGNLLA